LVHEPRADDFSGDEMGILILKWIVGAILAGVAYLLLTAWLKDDEDDPQ
jgi:hypothetical protein